MAQSVEHILGKDEVISSILISSLDTPEALTASGVFFLLTENFPVRGGLQNVSGDRLSDL